MLNSFLNAQSVATGYVSKIPEMLNKELEERKAIDNQEEEQIVEVGGTILKNFSSILSEFNCQYQFKKRQPYYLRVIN